MGEYPHSQEKGRDMKAVSDIKAVKELEINMGRREMWGGEWDQEESSKRKQVQLERDTGSVIKVTTQCQVLFS